MDPTNSSRCSSRKTVRGCNGEATIRSSATSCTPSPCSTAGVGETSGDAGFVLMRAPSPLPSAALAMKISTLAPRNEEGNRAVHEIDIGFAMRCSNCNATALGRNTPKWRNSDGVLAPHRHSHATARHVRLGIQLSGRQGASTRSRRRDARALGSLFRRAYAGGALRRCGNSSFGLAPTWTSETYAKRMATRDRPRCLLRAGDAPASRWSEPHNCERSRIPHPGVCSSCPAVGRMA